MVQSMVRISGRGGGGEDITCGHTKTEAGD